MIFWSLVPQVLLSVASKLIQFTMWIQLLWKKVSLGIIIQKSRHPDNDIIPFFIQLILLQLHGRMLNSTAHHPTYLYSLPARIALNWPAAKKMQQLWEPLCIIHCMICLSEAIMLIISDYLQILFTKKAYTFIEP